MSDADIPASVTLASLATKRVWVGWQLEQRGNRLTKVPYTTANQKARNNDPETWVTRAEAEKCAAELPQLYGKGGIGIELTNVEDGLSIGGVDFDSCRDKDGNIEPWAGDLVKRLGTYTEISPSDTGLKCYFTYQTTDLPKLHELKLLKPNGFGRKFANGTGDHAPAIEVYLGGRYFAVTEHQHDGTPTEFRCLSLDDLVYLLSDAGPAFAQPKATKEKKAGTDSTRSATVFRSAAKAKRAGKAYPEWVEEVKEDPETKEWFEEKGDDRQLERAWERAGKDSEGILAVITEFNSKYFVVNEAGRAVIYAPAYDTILHRKYFDRMGFSDLQKLYMNRKIEVGHDGKDNPIMRSVASIWLEHTERKQYIGGVVFDPSGASITDDKLNLWQGFAFTPREGCWSKLRDHILKVICCGNVEHANYLLYWMARMIKRPAEQGEVAIVMKGVEGCGKGTLAKILKRIMGQHGLAISNSKHLTGNFNAHLRDCVFLFADEAFFAGDKAHVGVLKAIITEPHLTIEGKYQNAIQTPNYLHVMMASNESWVVPASLEARRFFVLDVSPDRRNDHDWFKAIWDQMDNGGYEAMLEDLLTIDLTNFNARSVPVTDGLQEQKKLSLPTDKLWWLDVLQRGYVLRSRLGLEDDFGQWHETVATELLYSSYTEFAERKRERHLLSRETFGHFMREMGGKPLRASNLPVGEHITDVETAYGSTRKAKPVIHSRPPAFHLGPLNLSRAAFASTTSLTISWQDAQP